MIFLSLIPLAVLGLLVAAVVAGYRALAGRDHGDDGEGPIDTAEAAKSLAIHVGLFLALIACAVGLIDLFQTFVEGRRIAGSSSQLARALALLIVGVPTYALLLRVVDRRNGERNRLGDTKPPRGWSVYLVAALTLGLIGSITSVIEITDSITSDFDEYEPTELVQMVVWASVWLAHWFLLRPRYGVRGAVHLAVGSITGLGLMVAGLWAVIYRVLDRAYHSAFDNPLAGSFDTAFWIVMAVVGAVAWGWHWLAHLNSPGSIEGDRRQTPLWSFTIVVSGVLPGLIAMLISSTAAVSGLLIWLIGSTNDDAADFFEPAPALITVFLVALVTWAYHRWELDRSGAPSRDESLRFHDYVVLSVGLVGVVGSIAMIMSLLIDAASAGEQLAGSFNITNSLIIAVTVAAASAAVWWKQWSLVERQRAKHPMAESDSIWRKLYLIIAFGIGGIVLGVSVIWVLFVFLRDVLDSMLGDGTLQDLRGPLGWGIAVMGAAWYHVGVWRVDRAVLATQEAAQPDDQLVEPSGAPAQSVVAAPTPTSMGGAPTAVLAPPVRVTLRTAEPGDAGELFTLQRAAFADQAATHGKSRVPALVETFDELRAWLTGSTTLLAIDGSRIVGAISTRPHPSSPPTLERLITAPDRGYEGIATALLTEAEAQARVDGHDVVAAIVPAVDATAQTFFEDHGYLVVSGRDEAPQVRLHKSL